MRDRPHRPDPDKAERKREKCDGRSSASNNILTEVGVHIKRLDVRVKSSPDLAESAHTAHGRPYFSRSVTIIR